MEESRRFSLLFLLFFLLFGMVSLSSQATSTLGMPWYQQDEDGSWQVHLYFYWSAGCPHCQEARPVVEKWRASRPWLVLHSSDLTGQSAHHAEYMAMARQFGREARSVPAFFYCNKMVVGFDHEAGMGERIRTELDDCHQQLLQGHQPALESHGAAIDIPLLGDISVGDQSLLLVTAVIATLDAFNPCAFFVLLFLLSLLIHSRSRQRMMLIGGVFIFFSGAIYFLFMAAWLNLFLLLGVQRLFTVGAGLVAVTMALINLKDFFLPGRGISLSIKEEKRTGLFQRVRGLLQAQNMVGVMLGTIALAIAANSYELLCTSGLPMVYTRILTLASLSSGSYYLYLLLYNVIYIVPLLLILLLFTFTLGQRKLQAEEGRLLKLLSGIMMFELGLGLMWVPESLHSVSVVVAGMLSALALTAFAGYFIRTRQRRL